MTLYELMPALWLVISFLLFVAYIANDSQTALCGCGAALFALCPAVLSARLYVQAVFFFSYFAAVAAASFIFRKKHGSDALALAVTVIDGDGGFIMFRGSVYAAFSKDPDEVYATGDVLNPLILPDGSLCVYRD